HFADNTISKAIITESLQQTRNFSSYNINPSKPTVFLSHKHDDLEDLKGFMKKVKDLGVEVYIDSMDSEMPKQTSGETAHRIKQVIKETNKFILLATNNAIESYWCNWELGIGDTHKYIDHIAILAIKERNTLDTSYK